MYGCGCKFCNKCITKNFKIDENVLHCPKCNRPFWNLQYDTLPESLEITNEKKLAKETGDLSEVTVNNASSTDMLQNVNVDKVCSDLNANTVLSEQVCKYLKSLYICLY